ncbi:MAG: hypothetical protein ACUVXA_10950 [Candidatus Jordarchaeum sp.]|uniref:hypothetical protein n=1 Tax=Candidatus Jordarchaeum sp. TaxID=2823881 RepID=UPI00404AF1F3
MLHYINILLSYRIKVCGIFRFKRKAEQQAFSRYGLTYVVDEYLPKFKEIDRMKEKGTI